MVFKRERVMRLVAALLCATLVLPGVAQASGRRPEGAGKPADVPKGKAVGYHTKATTRIEAKTAAKGRADAAGRRQRAVEAPVRTESDDATPSIDPSRPVEPTSSVEGTRAVGKGVANALSRITRNIERRIAKFGWDEGVPMGLVRVWLKFTTWLGGDTSANPWTPRTPGDTTTTPTPGTDTSPTPPPSGETSGSVEPSVPGAPVAP